MRINNIIISMFFSIIVILAMAPMATSIPIYEEVYVDDSSLGGAHFDTIAEALDNVLPGGTVHIGDGHHAIGSSISISFDVTISGAGQDLVIIDADGGGFPVFTINNANVSIMGCSVTGGTHGVLVQLSDAYIVRVSGNNIYGNSANGIYIDLNTGEYVGFYLDVYVTGNLIHDNGGRGIASECDYQYSYLDVSYNTIYSNGEEGLYVDADTGQGETVCAVLHNEIYGNGAYTNNTGIHVIDSIENVLTLLIDGNYIHDEDGDGILLVCDSVAYVSILFRYNTIMDDWVLIQGNDVAYGGGNGVNLIWEIELFPFFFTPQGAVIDGESYYSSSFYIIDNDIHGNGQSGIASDILMLDIQAGLYLDSPVEAIDIESSLCLSENEIYENSQYGIEVNIAEAVLQLPFGQLNGNEHTYQFAYIYRNEIYENEWGGIRLEDVSAYIINNLIAENPGGVLLDIGAERDGIYLQDCYLTYVLNNTIINNLNGIRLDNSVPRIENNIITDNVNYGIYMSNSPSELPEMDGVDGYRVAFNDVWNNGTDYDGIMIGIGDNISVDPQFYGLHDARLIPGSPCIDAGNNEVLHIIYEDLVGTSRPIGMGVDMGCYEMEGTPWSPKWITPLAMASMADANTRWACVLEGLPDAISPEAQSLLDEVQALMEGATSLSNPVYVNGIMMQALDLLEEVDDMLECGCHS